MLEAQPFVSAAKAAAPAGYAVVISKGKSIYRATVPDLPGCAAVCRSRTEVEALIHDAITAHVAGLRRQGHPVPEPTTYVIHVDADSAQEWEP
jgi:predicted RNase H-like HicB family nuclease